MDWTFQDVVDIHRRNNVQPNPLYLKKATRVGCFPCIFARKDEIRWIAENHPERIDLIEKMEEMMTAYARDRKGPDSAPLTFFHAHDDSGPMPIRKVAEWSKTSYGGKQKELFALEEDGCMRWGLCGTLESDGWETEGDQPKAEDTRATE
jgi:3'-phosphoadenosine 5'-phosphosulfate sulfotransferase (PAPS reductase)/FAD synthetase